MDEIVKCTACDEEFDIEYEGVDIDDEYYCDHCRHENVFNCPECGDYELEKHRGDIGTVLIVKNLEDEDAGVPDGIYEIKRWPYYGGSMLGLGHIFDFSVKRIGEIQKGMDDAFMDGYACAHVCRHCSEVVKRRAILFRRFS